VKESTAFQAVKHINVRENLRAEKKKVITAKVIIITREL
jgi:hypothetical protein